MNDKYQINDYQLALEEILAELNIKRDKADFQAGIAQSAKRYQTKQGELRIQQRETLDWLINYISAIYECAILTKKIGDTLD